MNRDGIFHSTMRLAAPLALLAGAYWFAGQWLANGGLILPPVSTALAPILAFSAGILALAGYSLRRGGMRLGTALGLLAAGTVHLQTLLPHPVLLPPTWLTGGSPTLGAVLLLAGCLAAARVYTGLRVRPGWRLALSASLLVAGAAAVAFWLAAWSAPIVVVALALAAVLGTGLRRGRWRTNRLEYWLVYAAAWGTVLALAAIVRDAPLAPAGIDLLYGLLLWGTLADLASAPRRRHAAVGSARIDETVAGSIARIASEYHDDTEAGECFGTLLGHLREVAESGYGFIGEVLPDRQGRRCFSLRAVTTDRGYAADTMEVDDPQTVVGSVCIAGEVLIRNARGPDGPERGLPPGHPRIDSLMVLPLYAGRTLVAVVALANRRHGYSPECLERLQPLARLCGTMIRARADARERRAAQAAVRGNLAAMEASIDGMAIVGEDGLFTYVNRAHAALHGFPNGAELVGRSWQTLYDERELECFRREIIPRFMKHRQWRGECIGRRADGETFPQELSLTAMVDGGTVCVVRDITERKLAEGRIHRLAHYDALTGLPNRRLLHERLGQALLQARRAGRILAILFLDLDRFKSINDSYGHEAGDVLLKAVGARFSEAVRGSDIVARIGGDEFVVALTNLGREQDIVVVTEKLRTSLDAPIVVNGEMLKGSASIGISMYPNDGTEIDVLIRKADDAMYRAKARGRDGYAFHAQAVNARVSERLHMEKSLRRAVEHGEFVLQFQPVTDLPQGHATGVEALLRWEHPDLGLVFPSNFLPFAEESGLIVPIGQWVLEEACRRARTLAGQGLGDLHVDLNLSACQFRDPALAETIGEALRRTGADPHCLAVEVTEAILTEPVDPDLAHNLRALRELGVQLNLDHYGTGAVSPPQLHRYAPQALKIDRSFIGPLLQDRNCVRVTTAIIAMARTLGIRVIAEGVETAEQLALLREQRCDGAQGHYLSKALSWDECLTWIGDRRETATASRAG
mgnify:CR=1 FL=1